MLYTNRRIKMDWNAIGALGEVIGAVALVVTSLIYQYRFVRILQLFVPLLVRISSRPVTISKPKIR